MHRSFLRAGTIAFATICAACSFAGSPTATDAGIDRGGDASAADVSAPDAATDASTNTRAFASPSCPTGQAPISDGRQRGSFTCTSVGASTISVTEAWPDVTGARLPLVYVRPGAANGDGSMAMPFGTLTEALTALDARGNGTVVLAAGEYSVDATVAITHDVSMLGIAGPMGSFVSPPGGAPAFDVATAGVTLALTGVNVNKNVAHTGPAIRASNGANLVLRDVAIDSSEIGVQLADDTTGMAPGAHLDALHLTVTRASGVALHLGASGDALVRSVRIESSRVGIKSSGATLDAGEGMAHEYGAAGVSIDFSSRTLAGTVRLDRIALWDGDGFGAWLGGSTLTVAASRLLVAGARAITGASGTGVGLLVSKGAHLDLDTTITADAQQGLGSIIAANAGTGLVFDQNATATMRGAYVASNQQSGVVIQATANVMEVGYSYFTDNLGSGLMVSTGGIIAGLLCNGFVGNQIGSMLFTQGAVTMQDGVVIAPQTTSYTVVVSGSLFANNARYGIVFVGVDPVLMGNTFTNNPMGGAAVFGGNATGAQSMSNDVTQTPSAGAAADLPGSVATPGAP